MIREERTTDAAAIRAVHTAAFGRDNEAALVDRLRNAADPYLGLVADDHGEIIGHVAFSPVSVVGAESHPALGLAPLGVLPDRQHKGVGTALVRQGLLLARDRGFDAVVVVGDPDYYVRFGFAPAIELGLTSEFEVPADAFQVLEITHGALMCAEGMVRYHEAFSELD